MSKQVAKTRLYSNVMKLWMSLCLLVGAQLVMTSDVLAKRRVIKPKECRTSNYTCVLKKNDGVPFFCVRTARQRHQNARKKVRIVSRRTCIRRYPVEYEEVGPPSTDKED